MAKTLEQLLSLSTIIANETKAGANTALRVGGLFSDIIYYLRDLDYADKDDIPSLEGYATEQWVLGKGYATTSDLDTRIDALVNGAPQAYDTLKEISDVLAGNVNSISDILTALGNKADKATTLSGYGITDAYTITQIDSIVKELSGDISTLEGYFTDGVANSALKLSDNGSYTAWGQTFFTNGKPKSLSGALTDVTDIASSGTITTNKIVIGNGTIEWDEANKGFKVTGLYSTTYLSAKGANTNGGGSSGGGLIESLWKVGDLGKTFNTDANDTFNAYAINAIHSRVSVLEGKATNVSFTQSLTSGTQIGVITIDGASKNIYAPTIPTSDINKGVTAYGWGNHASAGYAMASALGGYQTKITSSNKLDYSLISGVPTKLSQFTNDLGLESFAYKSSLAFADLTNKPTTISGYGITDAYTKTQVDSALGGYLPLSGGTLTGAILIGAYTSFGVSGDNFYLGSPSYPLLIRCNGDAKLNGNAIIHSGNIGNQSVNYASSAGLADFSTYTKGFDYTSSNLDLNNLSRPMFWFYGQGDSGLNNVPPGFMYGGGITFRQRSETTLNGQFAWDINHNTSTPTKNLWFRASNNLGLGNDWKTIAFTDSNVATATKLQTARSIWGQSFDGTGDIVGTLTTNTKKSNYIVNYSTYYAGGQFYANDISAGEEIGVYVGQSYAAKKVAYMSYHQGASDNETYATLGLHSVDNAIVMKTSGNVGIGTTNPQYKLDVNGNLFAVRLKLNNICLECGPDGSASGCSSEINNFTDSLYMQLHSSLGISMCHGGGNVAVGMVSAQYKLDVNGVIHSNTGIFSDGYVSAKGQNTSSDMRLKNVLNEIVIGVKDIANAPSVRFAWKNGGGVDVGSSAQYWQGVLPDAVKERDGMLEMQYANIALLSAIALAKNFETMDERVARLEKENKELRNEIKCLKYGA